MLKKRTAKVSCDMKVRDIMVFYLNIYLGSFGYLYSISKIQQTLTS